MAENIKTIAENRQARHEYFILESLEAGIELCGTEVKSIRGGGVSLKEAWISIEDGEAYVKQMHIAPDKAAYAQAGNTALVRTGHAGRTYPYPHFHVFQGQQSQGAGRPVQGQKAVRQA